MYRKMNQSLDDVLINKLHDADVIYLRQSGDTIDSRDPMVAEVFQGL